MHLSSLSSLQDCASRTRDSQLSGSPLKWHLWLPESLWVVRRGGKITTASFWPTSLEMWEGCSWVLRFTILWFEDQSKFPRSRTKSNTHHFHLRTSDFHLPSLLLNLVIAKATVCPRHPLTPKFTSIFHLQALDVSDHFPVEFKLQSSRAFTNNRKSVALKKRKRGNRS